MGPQAWSLSPTLILHRQMTACVLLTAMLLASPEARAQKGRLDFCARPVAPACVDTAETYGTAALREACSAEVKRFLEMTFAYRKCLNSQLENEIRDTNAINDRFKCRLKNGKTCP